MLPTIRILIVEDNPGDAKLIRRMLESLRTASFVIVEAATLAGALAQLHPPVSLVFLDLNLPDSQDLDTLVRLRACAPVVPIFVWTGMEDRQKAVQALNYGAQDYLVKGHVDSHLLERAIFRHLHPLDSQTTA